MQGFWKILVGSFFLLPLFACGGGGGGGGGAPAAVTNLVGTVSDSTQRPVAGATVTVVDGTSGATVQTVTTDAAGRYRAVNLPKGTPLTVVASGPEGTFPSQIEGAVITSGVVTVLDFYLPSSGPATEVSPGVWQSQAMISGPLFAYVELTGGAPSAVQVAPFDVSQIGNGFPTYSVSPLALGVDEIFELFASAAFSTAGTPFTSADLYLPVPSGLLTAADAADDISGVDSDILYRFDTASAAWVDTGIDPALTVDPVNATPAFVATVTEGGLYRVGAPSAADPVLGAVTYADGTTPAAGVTVFVTGSDYGYQQVVTTDADGNFSALVKAGGASDYQFVAWGYGLQLTAGGTSPNITLPFAAPLPGVAAAASITLDDLVSPFSIGLIAASGRLSTDSVVIDGTILTPGRADVSFNYDAIYGLTLNATTKGSGIQELLGTSFDALHLAPSSGYSAYNEGLSVYPFIEIDPAGGQVFVVKTDVGYAKIGIDSVSGVGPWEITFRLVFSLTGSF